MYYKLIDSTKLSEGGVIKTHNQLIAIAMSGAMVLALTACGGNKDASAGTAASTAETTAVEASSNSATTIEFSQEDLASIATTGSTEVASAPAGGVTEAFGSENYIYNSVNSNALADALANPDSNADVEEAANEGSTDTAGVLNAPTGKLGSGSYGSFSTGYTYSDKYTNSFFTFKFDLPAGWLLGNSYDLESMNNGFTGAYSDSQTQRAVDNGGDVTVMVAGSSDGTKLATVDVFNRDVLFPGITNVDDFFYTIANGQANSLANSGYSNVRAEIASTYVFGDTYSCINVSGNYGGSPFYMKTVFTSAGPYMAMITVSSTDYDSTSLYISYFGDY